MYQPANTFQSGELTEDELAVVTGGLVGDLSLSLPSMGSCDVCGPGIGVLGIAGSGLGPFISAFNNETIYNVTNNITLNVYIMVPH
jgi:hypothetical protein